MDGRIDYLENMSVERRTWRIQVRAVRVWKQPSYVRYYSGIGDCLDGPYILLSRRNPGVNFGKFSMVMNRYAYAGHEELL